MGIVIVAVVIKLGFLSQDNFLKRQSDSESPAQQVRVTLVIVVVTMATTTASTRSSRASCQIFMALEAEIVSVSKSWTVHEKRAN